MYGKERGFHDTPLCLSMLFIPFPLMPARFGLTNRTGALFLVHPVFCIPHTPWISMANLKSIPVIVIYVVAAKESTVGLHVRA